MNARFRYGGENPRQNADFVLSGPVAESNSSEPEDVGAVAAGKILDLRDKREGCDRQMPGRMDKWPALGTRPWSIDGSARKRELRQRSAMAWARSGGMSSWSGGTSRTRSPPWPRSPEARERRLGPGGRTPWTKTRTGANHPGGARHGAGSHRSLPVGGDKARTSRLKLRSGSRRIPTRHPNPVPSSPRASCAHVRDTGP